MKQLFSQHISYIQQVVQQALAFSNFDGLWIYAGEAKSYFLDDQTAPFKINPHFNAIFPDPNAEKSWLFLDGIHKPKIFYFAPQDYWASMPNPPIDAFYSDQFEWQILKDEQDIRSHTQSITKCAFIGENRALAQVLGFQEINPRKLLNVLHFERSIKTEFEISCIANAQYSALKGHQAAKRAFFDGKSEFDINLAYLQASSQSDNNVPYGNIVAINEHSAILHYTNLSHLLPKRRQSFLLDAGATYLGYASDITRSYAFDEKSEFAELIQLLEKIKYDIISQMLVGDRYLSYHIQAHKWISQLLKAFDFVYLSPEVIFDEGISRTFFPHGLGHLLGLQVHDVAGLQQNRRGTHQAPPDVYASLRCTRILAEGMVLTVEPGLYFIEMLLNKWRMHSLSKYFNWEKIEKFKSFGGIRTEDNIVIRSSGAENLTLIAEKKLNNY